jgi:transposase
VLERCRALGFLKARGQQRTDAPHALAAMRVLSRLELVAEMLRAALNALATVVPDWLQTLAPLAWYERYGKRIEDTRLPSAQAARAVYARTVGEDGFRVLDAVERPEAPADARALPTITTLRRTWQRHYQRRERPGSAMGHPPILHVRFKVNRELPRAAEGGESPDDTEARYRHKRETQWTGDMVHVGETWEPTSPHLLTHVHTTTAAVHDARCTAPIQQA